jgi:hypothetical protein
MFEVRGVPYDLEGRGKRIRNLPQAERSSSEVILKP